MALLSSAAENEQLRQALIDVAKMLKDERARADELDDRVVKLTDAAVRNAHTIERRGAERDRWQALADDLAAKLDTLIDRIDSTLDYYNIAFDLSDERAALARYRARQP